MAYGLIVYLEGDEAQDAIDAYHHGGGKEVLDVLTDHDTGEVSEVSEDSFAAVDDETMRIGDYNVFVNPEAGAVGLEVIL
jgi:uncharacterized glyoxalase superfamily protein PhnB